MADISKAPYIPPEVVSYLDQLFPDRMPSKEINDRELGIKMGERRVVALLSGIVKRQENRTLS